MNNPYDFLDTITATDPDGEIWIYQLLKIYLILRENIFKNKTPDHLTNVLQP